MIKKYAAMLRPSVAILRIHRNNSAVVHKPFKGIKLTYE